MRKSRRRRWGWGQSLAAFIIIASGLISIWQSRPDGQFHLWVLDVGQGDAIFIQTPDNRQILIDGGPSDQVLVELGQHMPFWDRSLDLVILSHPHADHLTGLIDVARRFQIGEVWTSGAVHTTPEFTSWQAVLASRHVRQTNVWAGANKQFDKLGLEVLYPLTDQTGVRPTSQHEATVVVRLTTGSATALLTGDLETEQENKIVAVYCPDQQRPCPRLKAGLLKVPHHGSKTGLEPDFLAAIAPEQAVISCGEKNPYGHPHPITLERLAAAAIATWRTDRQGTIEARPGEDNWAVSSER